MYLSFYFCSNWVLFSLLLKSVLVIYVFLQNHPVHQVLKSFSMELHQVVLYENFHFLCICSFLPIILHISALNSHWLTLIRVDIFIFYWFFLRTRYWTLHVSPIILLFSIYFCIHFPSSDLFWCSFSNFLCWICNFHGIYLSIYIDFF